LDHCLLFQCDGILCDGASRENAVSTVVDCREIDKGKLGFYRIGLTPKSDVLEILDKVLERHGKLNKQSKSNYSNGLADAEK
jgi:predicted protein tyrosine phosphatase